MATRDEEDKRLIEEGLKALSEKDAETETELAERKRIFEELAAKIEQPGLQDKILERYQSVGKTLLADTLPTRVDPSIARALRPHLGDVSDVRIHTGKVATEAASAMQARAFAIGDKDIFFDRQEFDPASREGAALIAHEIAHTRDAATGFALSSRLGEGTSAREQFAHEIQHKFAREWVDDGENPLAEESDTSAGVGTDGMRKEPQVDKRMLAEKIVKILESQARRQGERTGKF